MIRLGALVALVGCVCEDPVGELDVAACVRERRWDAAADGWQFRQDLTSSPITLSQGEAHPESMQFLGPLAYRVVGCADEGAHDLDIIVYGPTGETFVPIATDGTDDRLPTVDFIPPRSGQFQVQLFHQRAAAQGRPATVAAAVLFR